MDLLRDAQSLIPILSVISAGLLMPMVGVFVGEGSQRLFSLVYGVLASVGAIALCFLFGNPALSEGSTFFSGMIVKDALNMWGSALTLLFAGLSMSVIFRKKFKYDDHPSLVGGLLLLSASGAMLMMVSTHLLLIFIGLELLSIPLYVLTSIHHASSKASEASFKYFLLGAVASAFFVFGTALLWGESGTLLVPELSRVLFDSQADSILLKMGFVFVVAAMLFKMGLVPFQMWVPDVYESAPASLTSWMAGSVKLASLVVVLRFASEVSLDFVELKWIMALKWICIVSMLWGSLGALFQKNLKRLLAYSSVSHAGYMFMGVLAAFHGAYDKVVSAAIFYALSYGLATLAGFAILSVLEETSEHEDLTLSHLKGLYEKSPSMALALSVAVLSLAGLPPLAGFFAKYQMFSLVLEFGHVDLLVVAVLTSVVSLGYYLKAVLFVMMEPLEAPASSHGSHRVSLSPAMATLAIIVLGILPWGTLPIVQSLWK